VLEHTPFLLSDTVGFIRKLPHHLVEAFKSTLSEAQDSDILLHVVDVSHPHFEDQIQIVNQTLQENKMEDKRTLVVFNKADRLTTEERAVLEETWFGLENAPSVFVSATERWNIEMLREKIVEMVRETHKSKYPDTHYAWEEYEKYGKE
jgi:GTP-binding protein HflX